MKKARKIILIGLLVVLCAAMAVGTAFVTSALFGDGCDGCEGKDKNSSEKYQDTDDDGWTKFY